MHPPVLSALVADTVLFNSRYNMDYFLSSLDSCMKTIPDSAQRVMGLKDVLAPKCSVLHFPVDPPDPPAARCDDPTGSKRARTDGAEGGTPVPSAELPVSVEGA